MFATLGQSFLNIIAPLPDDEEDDNLDGREEVEDEIEDHSSDVEVKASPYPMLVSANPVIPIPESSEGQGSGVSELMDINLDDGEGEPMETTQTTWEDIGSFYHSASREPLDSLIINQHSAENHLTSRLHDGIILGVEHAPDFPVKLPVPSGLVTPLSSILHSASEEMKKNDLMSEDKIDYMVMYLRVQEDLRSSEESLKEAEHSAWHARAEASELLFSLELEQKATAEAKKSYSELSEILKALYFQVTCTGEDDPVKVVQGLKHVLNASTLEIEILKSSVTESNQKLVDVQKRFAMTQEELHALQEEIQKRNDIQTVAEVELGREEAVMRQRLEVLERDLSTAREERVYVDNQMLDLQTQVEKLEEANAELSAAQQRLDRSIVTTPLSVSPEDHTQMLMRLDELTTVLLAVKQEKVVLEEKFLNLMSEFQQPKYQNIEATEQQLEALSNDLELSQIQLAKRDNDLALLQQERAELQAVIADNAAITAQYKLLISKSDVEVKQLHQVIGQLRQARRAVRDEEEDAVAERDVLRDRVAQLERDLRDSVDQMQKDGDLRVTGYITRCESLEIEADDLRCALQAAERRAYDNAAEAENARADAQVSRLELVQKTQELSNMLRALTAFERDALSSQRKTNEVWQQRLDEMRREEGERANALVAEWTEKLRNQEALTKSLAMRSTEEEVSRRKLLMDCGAERARMQQTLDQALRQLQNSREDVVDRALVANLIVSYISRRRPRDVLQLLSKILAFSDVQLIEVGLKVAPTNLVDNLFSALAPKVDKVDVEGDNLAELWVNFLLEESTDNSSVNTSRGNAENSKSFTVGETPKKIK